MLTSRDCVACVPGQGVYAEKAKALRQAVGPKSEAPPGPALAPSHSHPCGDRKCSSTMPFWDFSVGEPEAKRDTERKREIETEKYLNEWPFLPPYFSPLTVNPPRIFQAFTTFSSLPLYLLYQIATFKPRRNYISGGPTFSLQPQQVIEGD